MLKRLLSWFALFVFIFVVGSYASLTASSADEAAAEVTPAPTLLDLLRADGRFTTFMQVANSTGIDSMLASHGPFTVFAPTDAAFDALPADLLPSLDGVAQRHLILYHMAQGKYEREQLLATTGIRSALGRTISVGTQGNGIVLNETSFVQQADLPAANGVVHIVSRVLEVPSLPAGPAAAGDQPAVTAPPAADHSDSPPNIDLFLTYDGPRANPRVVFELSDGNASLGPALVDFHQAYLIKSIDTVLIAMSNTSGLLGDLVTGSMTNCPGYFDQFLLVSLAPVFQNIPADAANFVARYEAAVKTYLDRNRPLMLYCINGGGFSEFNYSIAVTGVDEAIAIMKPLQAEVLTAYTGAPPVVIAPPEPADTADNSQAGDPFNESYEDTVYRLFYGWGGPWAEPRVTLGIPELDNGGLLDPAFVAFRTNDFNVSTRHVKESAEKMGGLLDRVAAGSVESCQEYIEGYISAALAPVFDAVPASDAANMGVYNTAINKLLDTNRPLILFCFNGGNFSNFNFMLARNGINEAINMLQPLLNQIDSATTIQ